MAEAKDIADELRAAIVASGQPIGRIARHTGVSQLSLSRFMQRRDLGMKNASIVAAYLGLRLEFEIVKP